MKKCLVTLLFILIVFNGCSSSSQNFSMSYNAKTDYDSNCFMQGQRQCVADADGGIYFYCGFDLFFLSEEADEAVPVCGKPNCQHDPDAGETCNAYIHDPKFLTTDSTGILAVASSSQSAGSQYSLWRISFDGSERNELLTFPVGEEIQSIAFHREYAYYSVMSFDNNGVGSSKLYRWSMTSTSEEPEKLWEEKNCSAADIQCFGKKIYFSSVRSDDEDSAIHILCYDLQQQTTSELFAELFAEQSGLSVGVPRKWNDQLLVLVNRNFDSKTFQYQESNDYLLNLDGSNPALCTGFEGNRGYRVSDGQYLYRVRLSKKAFPDMPFLTMYDKDGKELANIPENDIVNSGSVIGNCDKFLIFESYDYETNRDQIYTLSKEDLAHGTITVKLILDENLDQLIH